MNLWILRIQMTQTKDYHEQSTSTGWHEEGRLHPDLGWQARAMGGQRPAFRRLGNVPSQRLARGPEPHLRIAKQRMVRPDRPALGRRRQNLAASRKHP